MNRMLVRRFWHVIALASLLVAASGCSTVDARTNEERIELTACEGEHPSTRTLAALGAECGEVRPRHWTWDHSTSLRASDDGGFRRPRFRCLPEHELLVETEAVSLLP